MKTYHSALKSKVPQTLPFDTGFTPGPIYQPKTALLSGRRHGLLTDGTRTIPLGPIAVREPDKISPEFYKSYERFQVSRTLRRQTPSARRCSRLQAHVCALVLRLSLSPR